MCGAVDVVGPTVAPRARPAPWRSASRDRAARRGRGRDAVPPITIPDGRWNTGVDTSWHAGRAAAGAQPINYVRPSVETRRTATTA